MRQRILYKPHKGVIEEQQMEVNASVRDSQNALHWHMQEAAKGNARSAWELAKIYTGQKKYDLALPWLEQAVSGDISSALVYLAAYYLNGWGVEKNANSAFSLYLEAAKREEKEAYYSLALLYQHGVGTDKNLKKAWYWAAKSLAEGIAVSKSYAIMEEYSKYYRQAHADEIAAEEKARERKVILAEKEKEKRIQKERRFHDILKYESDERIISTLTDMWNRGDKEAGAVISEYLVNNNRRVSGADRTRGRMNTLRPLRNKGWRQP